MKLQPLFLVVLQLAAAQVRPPAEHWVATWGAAQQLLRGEGMPGGGRAAQPPATPPKNAKASMKYVWWFERKTTFFLGSVSRMALPLTWIEQHLAESGSSIEQSVRAIATDRGTPARSRFRTAERRKS